MVNRSAWAIGTAPALLLACFSFCCTAQSLNTGAAWPCDKGVVLLKDQQGAPVWIGFEELKQHATNAPIPPVPSGFRTSAHLVVDVLIGTDGRVGCVRVPEGHPLLQLAVYRAAKEWRFVPLVAGEHPVAVLGHLEFTFGK